MRSDSAVVPPKPSFASRALWSRRASRSRRSRWCFPEERLQAIYDKFGELGFPRRPFAEARERLDRWHEAYIPELEALIRRLLIPREFRLPPAVTPFSND